MDLAAIILVAAMTCEGLWTPGCQTLTYNGIDAGYCSYFGEDDICRSWTPTPYGKEIEDKRAAALPDCPWGMSLGELMEGHAGHPCKVPTDQLQLVPVPGGERAN